MYGQNSCSVCFVIIFFLHNFSSYHKSLFVDREEFQMGSLSHYINARTNGYHDLPVFPETAPDPSVRNVPTVTVTKPAKKQVTTSKKTSFYSDTDSDNSSPPNEGWFDCSNNQKYLYSSNPHLLLRNHSNWLEKSNLLYVIANDTHILIL